MTNHWLNYHRHWQLLRPPLRPDEAVIACVNDLLTERDGHCLLLGTTAEYAKLEAPIIALDASLPMIKGLWLAHHPQGSATQTDWASMPIASQAVMHVLADGSLNAVPFRSVLPRMLGEITRILKPGGRLIARVFCQPSDPDTIDCIRIAVADGAVASFHGLKWRVAMASVGDDDRPDIGVQRIRDAVVDTFADRDALCRLTGWPRPEIDTIDVYAGSKAIYNFPTRPALEQLLLRWFRKVTFVEAGAYELAGRCPIIVAESPR